MAITETCLSVGMTRLCSPPQRLQEARRQTANCRRRENVAVRTVAIEGANQTSGWAYVTDSLAGRRERVNSVDLWKIETLYREYCSRLSHHHVLLASEFAADIYESLARGRMLKCGLCAAVYHLREHIEGVFSKFENHIAVTRRYLISAIDIDASRPAIKAKDFLGKYRECWRLIREESAETEPDEILVKSLCETELWTFDQADQVRERCRGHHETGTGFDYPDCEAEVFDALTTAMTLASTCPE
jgi:hypothetical protein